MNKYHNTYFKHPSGKRLRHYWKFGTHDAEKNWYWLYCDRETCHAAAWVRIKTILKDIEWHETSETWVHEEVEGLEELLTGTLYAPAAARISG